MTISQSEAVHPAGMQEAAQAAGLLPQGPLIQEIPDAGHLPAGPQAPEIQAGAHQPAAVPKADAASRPAAFPSLPQT